MPADGLVATQMIAYNGHARYLHIRRIPEVSAFVGATY